MLIVFKHLNSMLRVSFLMMTWFLMVMPDSGGIEAMGQQWQRLPSPTGSPQPGLQPWQLMLCPSAPSAQTTCTSWCQGSTSHVTQVLNCGGFYGLQQLYPAEVFDSQTSGLAWNVPSLQMIYPCPEHTLLHCFFSVRWRAEKCSYSHVESGKACKSNNQCSTCCTFVL